MKNKITLLLVLSAFVAVVVAASMLYKQLSSRAEVSQLSTQDVPDSGQSQQHSEETEELAPDFTVYDADGRAVKLSDFRGKPVVLNFWASWCGPCKSEMPDFDAACKTYGQNIQFLMVNLTDGYQETLDSAKKFMADSGYSFPVFYDTDTQAATAYNVYSIPTTYFINAEGYVAAYGTGALSMDSLEKGIAMIS